MVIPLALLIIHISVSNAVVPDVAAVSALLSSLPQHLFSPFSHNRVHSLRCQFEFVLPAFTPACLPRCPQVWPKERWCPRYSAATGCHGPTTVPPSCMRSWCPAGRTNLRTGPPLSTCRASWMTSTPPQRHSTSNNHRQGHLERIQTFHCHSILYLEPLRHVFLFL